MKTFSRDEVTGQSFGHAIGSYLARFHRQSTTRRGLVRAAVSVTAPGIIRHTSHGAFLPGLSVLAHDATSVTFGLEGDPAGLEPALAYDQTTSPVVNHISEPLMCFAPDGSLECLLAEEFAQPDLLTYVYRLRPGLTFSDGSPVTAEDVVASIERVRNPDIASPLVWMYDRVATVAQTDERTVTIRLSEPSSTFKYVAATSAGHVIPKAVIQDPDRDLARDPIGTGPYTLVHWDAGSEIVLEKNPTYWQPGKPYFDRLVFKIIPEATTRVLGLKTGEIDITTGLSSTLVELAQQMAEVEVQETIGDTITYIALRMDESPFEDINVRKAVAYGIEMESIITNIVGSTGIRSRNTTVPPHMDGSAANELSPILYDLNKARQFLANSRHPNGFTTTLTMLAGNDVVEAEAIKIQQDLRVLNIDIELMPLPFADYMSQQTGASYEGMLHVFWSADFPDAAGLLLPHFHSRNIPVSNLACYSNPAVDALLDESEGELDLTKRLQLLKQVQHLVSEDQPYIFIDHFKWFMPMSTDLTGYTLTPMWMWDCFGRSLRLTDA